MGALGGKDADRAGGDVEDREIAGHGLFSLQRLQDGADAADSAAAGDALLYLGDTGPGDAVHVVVPPVDALLPQPPVRDRKSVV